MFKTTVFSYFLFVITIFSSLSTVGFGEGNMITDFGNVEHLTQEQWDQARADFLDKNRWGSIPSAPNIPNANRTHWQAWFESQCLPRAYLNMPGRTLAVGRARQSVCEDAVKNLAIPKK